ncbi:hypothetical protein YPPY92_2895, partial [Yersinia pestis PY-92]
MGGAVGV